jgi:hypothetical protein
MIESRKGGWFHAPDPGFNLGVLRFTPTHASTLRMTRSPRGGTRPGSCEAAIRVLSFPTMLLSFVVGNASDVFSAGLAAAVDEELVRRFDLHPLPDEDEPYHSDGVDFRGWAELQKRAASLPGGAPQLSGVDVYQSAYLPVALTSVEQLLIPNAADPLQCGSVPALLEELQSFAAAAALPTDPIELMGLAAKYLEDDALFDADLDVQMFIQLFLSAKQAAARKQPVWIVR